MKTLIGILLCLFVLSGCGHQISSKDLIGKYCLNRSLHKDSIFIYDNHTYAHRYHATNNRTFECKGNWEFNPSVNEIKFKDFLFFTDAGNDGLPPGNWDSRVVVTSNGKIQLIYSSEDNIYFQN